MKIVKMECPSCGANIADNIPEDMKYMFCKYCGQKMFIDDGVQRTEHHEINEDITEIKKAEFDNEFKLKELEHKERDDKRAIGLFLIIMGIAMLMMFFPIIYFSAEPLIAKAQGKKSAGSANDYKGKDVSVVTDSLRDLGFTNITTYDLNDAGWFWNKEGTVSEISIDGKSNFWSSDYFDPKATITIYYH